MDSLGIFVERHDLTGDAPLLPSILREIGDVRVKIAQTLQDAIETGRLPPGQKLRENELCRQLQVSRTSLREALRGLQTAKLITATANRSMHVSILSQRDAKAIFSLLGVIMAEGAYDLAGGTEPTLLARLQKTLSLAKSAAKTADRDQFGQQLQEFCRLWVHGTTNRVVRDIADSLLSRIAYWQRRGWELPARQKTVLKELACLLAAWKTGASEQAAAASRAYFNMEAQTALSLMHPMSVGAVSPALPADATLPPAVTSRTINASPRPRQTPRRR